MDDPVSAGVAAAAIKLMVRAGLVDPDDVTALADEHDRLSGFAGHDKATNEMIAHRLRCVMLDLDPVPDADPAIEFQAQQRRRQMRERTAFLERQEPFTE